MQRRTILLSYSALAFLTGVAQAQTTPVRIRGTIQSIDGAVLTVETRADGTARIALAPNYTVGAVVPTTLAAVKPGSMIGIVGFGPPKQQRAAVISIFPPGASVSESQFGWDSEPDSVMTNAPVTSEVASTDGPMLTVTVKGEAIQVSVPPNAIIQTTEPGTTAMLVKGAKVLVGAQKAADGTLTASRVNVGKDGFTPAN